MSPLFPLPDHHELERRLRESAPGFGPRPSAALRGRIVAAVRATPQLTGIAHEVRSARYGSLLAAAAAALVLCSAWWLTHRSEAPGRAASGGTGVTVVALSREILDAGSRVLALPVQAEDNLRLEAARLLSDTTHVAEGVVRGLPAPLRERLGRM